MKNWNQYEITTNFDKSLIIISWDGIKLKDAQQEVKHLAEKFDKKITDYNITKSK